RIPFDLVVKPTIKSAQDLRGKRLGVQVIGGTIWMGAMLGLEHLGLDPRRDAVQIIAAGDQTMLIQALEKGTVDATVVDSAFSNGPKTLALPRRSAQRPALDEGAKSRRGGTKDGKLDRWKAHQRTR